MTAIGVKMFIIITCSKLCCVVCIFVYEIDHMITHVIM